MPSTHAPTRPAPGPVGVIGLGRVGCRVLLDLLQGGYADLLLADSRAVTPEEVIDHPLLTLQNVGQPRSEALRTRVSTAYPHLQIQAGAGPGGPEVGPGWRYEGLSACQAVILAADGALPPVIHEVNEACLEMRVPLFPGIVLGQIAQLGPRVESGAGACLQCLELRIAAAAQRSPYPTPTPRPQPVPLDLVQGLSAALVAEVHRFLTGDDPRALLDRVLYLSSGGKPDLHHLLRTPRCPACGPSGPFMPYRMPRIAAPTEESPPADPERILRRLPHLVDPWCGVLRSLHRQEPKGVDPGIEVWVSQPASLDEFAPVGGGFSRHPKEAQAAALGEALERTSVSVECPEDLLIAPFREVTEHALDPRAWDLFHPSTQSLPGFPFAPISLDTPISWVWGSVLPSETRQSREERPVLVPASRVFMRFPENGVGDKPDVSLVSGFAAGSTREEATRRGLLEVLERDAFMIAWANRLPMRRVVLDHKSPHGIGDYVRALEARGMRVRCATLTLDLGVSLVVSILRFPGPVGEAAIVTAAADLDLAEACRRAIKEGAAGPPLIHRHYADAGGRLPEPIPEQVVTMDDHALLYARPEMFRYLEPWWRPAEAIHLGEAQEPRRAGHRSPLDRILASLTARGLTAIRIDLTHPALAKLGLYTVKVTVPGTYPMNFDSRFPHFGGERLYRVPVDTGLRSKPIPFEDLNRVPHPFP